MKQEIMTVVQQQQIAPRIYKLVLRGQLVAQMHQPGQFMHILVPRADLLLRRPISVCEINQQRKEVSLIYRIEGQGTLAMAQLQEGDSLDCMGPLGNGFQIDNLKPGDTAYIIGGGIGIPPLYELSKQLKSRGVTPIHFLGFTSIKDAYYIEEFQELGECHIATDDGSLGFKGNVGQCLAEYLRSADKPAQAVFSCGNRFMLKAVETLCSPIIDNVQISLEARMACGMGACYACVCKVKQEKTGFRSVKVCDDGPVFQAGKVEY